MLSNGLPPPLLVLPDLIDSASAGDVLVLLAGDDSAGDVTAVVGGGGVLTIEDVGGVGAGCVVVDDVVLCFVEGAGVAELVAVKLVALVVVAFVVESSVVCVLDIDCDVGIDIRGMVVLSPKPVVVVTTATLHST